LAPRLEIVWAEAADDDDDERKLCSILWGLDQTSSRVRN
jgi:hypothetical protein